MTDLEQRLREHYGQQTPSPELMATARAPLAAGVPDTTISLWQRLHSALTGTSRRRGVGVVVVCLLVLASTATFYQHGSINERTQRTVREVAMNHTTRLELEHQDYTIAALNERMDQLSFALTMPDKLQADYQPIGSRYCSLAGHLAAHVKLKHVDTGEAISLFVAPLEEELQALKTETAMVSGIDVELWQEGGLFFAKASRITQ